MVQVGTAGLCQARDDNNLGWGTPESLLGTGGEMTRWANTSGEQGLRPLLLRPRRQSLSLSLS